MSVGAVWWVQEETFAQVKMVGCSQVTESWQGYEKPDAWTLLAVSIAIRGDPCLFTILGNLVFFGMAFHARDRSASPTQRATSTARLP